MIAPTKPLTEIARIGIRGPCGGGQANPSGSAQVAGLSSVAGNEFKSRQLQHVLQVSLSAAFLSLAIENHAVLAVNQQVADITS